MKIWRWTAIWLLMALCSCDQNIDESEQIPAAGSGLMKPWALQEREQAVKDSINAVEQEKVIGEITFGMSKKQARQKLEKFRRTNKDKRGIYHKIGEYQYLSVSDLYQKGKLYSIKIEGAPIDWEYFKSDVPDQIEKITRIIKEKYGDPSKQYELMPRYRLEKNYTYLINQWDVGKKRIEVRVSDNGTSYSVDVAIYIPSIRDQVELDAVKKDIESAQKAKDVF